MTLDEKEVIRTMVTELDKAYVIIRGQFGGSTQFLKAANLGRFLLGEDLKDVPTT